MNSSVIKKLNKFSHIAVLKFKEEGEDENVSLEHTKWGQISNEMANGIILN